MNFIDFNNKKIDSFLFMELSDLAKTLMKSDDIEVEIAFQSYYDPFAKKMTVSHFWDDRNHETKVNGLKSDIYLRCIGNFLFSDISVFNSYLQKCKDYKLKSFAKQLFIVAEDLRIEEEIKKKRPGTRNSFDIRRNTYRHFFSTQLKATVIKSQKMDALFTAIYLHLTSQSPEETYPELTDDVKSILELLGRYLNDFYSASSSKDIMTISTAIMAIVEEFTDKDMILTYFHFPNLYDMEKNKGEEETIDDLTRKDPLQNKDISPEKKDEDEDIHDETLPVWHRETSDKTKSFLQFNLDQGSASNLGNGEGVREGEDGDQVMGIVQGSSRKTSRDDYSKLEADEEKKGIGKDIEEVTPFGKENSSAVAVYKYPTKIEEHHQQEYASYKRKVATYQKKLYQMMKKIIEHKKTSPRTNLHFGRLHKKLLKIVTEDHPRLFYKKQEPSPELDAVFTVLVDCSASMSNKMDEVKVGLTLFHETLKSLFVPHAVIGFYEDTNTSSEDEQPNYFHVAIDYASSLKSFSGPEVLQLEAEEDNRDGFAIRVVKKDLLKRTEKHKFLLVFSDGEPAAFGYEQNGIIDTHEAVNQARKEGIEVINIFLGDGEIDDEQRKVITNIYGRFSLFLENIEDLPTHLFPLLKKLLQKSI